MNAMNWVFVPRGLTPEILERLARSDPATYLPAGPYIAASPAGDLFVTERTGRIRIVRKGRLLPDPVALLDVAAVGLDGGADEVDHLDDSVVK